MNMSVSPKNRDGNKGAACQKYIGEFDQSASSSADRQPSHGAGSSDGANRICSGDSTNGDEPVESEASQVKQAVKPCRPSQQEVDEHMVTHLPFRSWCPHCVSGKSRGKQHARADASVKSMPTER